LLDYTDWCVFGPIVEAAHGVFGFRGVMTDSEPGAEPAGRVSDTLGLRGNSHRCAHLLRDKSAMRELLAAAPDAVAARNVTDIDSLTEFGKCHGFPFIVKPVDAAASFGVRLVPGPEAVAEVWPVLTALRDSTTHPFAHYFPMTEFLMEEYLDGPEYSVESISFDGDHILVAITEKASGPNFVEFGHALPARLTSADEAGISRCVTELLDAVEFRHGPAHTEVKLTEAGPRVIESHGRTGGDRIRDLVEAAYGLDLERQAIGWAAGVLPALTAPASLRQAAATRFLTAEPGQVVGIDGVADVLDHEGVLDVDIAVAVGDMVRPVQASWDRVGQVLLTAPSTADAVALCARLARQISVTTEQAPR
jgi:biotin carboxylase